MLYSRTISNPFLSALGVAFLGLALGWLAVRLRIPFPAGLFILTGFASALFLLARTLTELAGRRGSPRRAVTVPLAVAGMLVLLPGCIALPFLSGHIANDYRLAAFAERIHAYPAPPGATVLAEGVEVGLLTGNGNHCDYVATVVLRPRHALSRADIERHYDQLAPVPAVPGWTWGDPSYKVEVYASDLEGGNRSDSLDRMFVVRFVNAPYPDNWDWRCM